MLKKGNRTNRIVVLYLYLHVGNYPCTGTQN
jgi:hypothetical protein